jgi:hypothetical protein
MPDPGSRLQSSRLTKLNQTNPTQRAPPLIVVSSSSVPPY